MLNDEKRFTHRSCLRRRGDTGSVFLFLPLSPYVHARFTDKAKGWLGECLARALTPNMAPRPALTDVTMVTMALR